MKKIINGKVYNTETAECIADEGKSLCNFYSTSESLYRTKKGAFFIYGESSAGGRYGSSYGNTLSGGADIQAVDEKEVVEWAENADINDDEKSKIAEILSLEEA